MILDLNSDFWNDRYISSETGWDVGRVTTPIKEYINQLSDKEISILIPGCGNSYEAEYLFKNGFKNINLLDFSEKALLNFTERVPDFPRQNLLNIDFFDCVEKFDLIIEQTFFCAINKNKRSDYAKKAHDLLNVKGKLIGLLFDDMLNDDRPPFGGAKDEYIKYFEPYFNFILFDTAYNSISSRKGRELFVIFEKKNI